MSESMPADSGAVVAIPEIDGWAPVESDEDGLVNLSNAYGRNTVFLRRQLQAPEDLIVPLDVTYSDEITVFLNGRPLYSGVNGYQSRYPGYLGQLRSGNEIVYLPIRSAVNELTIAVTDEAFGWGVIARLAPGSGLLE